MSTSRIDLARRFAPLSEGPTALHVEMYLEVVRDLRQDIGWDELLAFPYAVVLGEAGTGKTTEFKMQPARLRQAGRSAFFADITDLASNGLDLAIPSDELCLLRAWKKGDDPAIFLLDSLDEAQLRQQPLSRALRRLAADLGEALTRVRLVVSCRVSDWSSESGGGALQEFARAAGAEGVEVAVVQIMPLDNEQFGRLAQHHGVEDHNRLIDAVREASAQPFVTRPLDVVWLAEYWKDQGRLGTLTELVDQSISKRLTERRPNSCPASPLPATRAREGLMRLAGLAVLSGRWSFQLPGEDAEGPGRFDAIDTCEALADWSAAEIRELLTRAVFDESTYGRVRLHHRTVQECLAAEWLRDMRSRGMRVRELRRLLFREVEGRVIVPAHLVPTAAWLASSEASVRDGLIEAMPEALLQHGDPASLQPVIRERVLDAYLRSYSGHDRRFDHFEQSTLRRFAPALDAAVGTHLARSDLPEEAVGLLLHIAALGSLPSALSGALSWARAAGADWHVRRRAFEAVGALADQLTVQELVRDLMQTTPIWDQNVAGAFARQFFPANISVCQLGEIIRRVEPGIPGRSTSIKIFMSYELRRACPVEMRADMLSDLIRSISVAARDKGWLLDSLQRLATVSVAFLSEMESPGSELREALLLLRRTRYVPFDGSAHRHELVEAITPKLGVRRWLFWTRVDEALARQRGEWPTSHLQVSHRHDLAALGEDDALWLAEDACVRTEPAARGLVFDCLLNMMRNAPALSEVVGRLAKDDPALGRLSELDERRRNTPLPENPYILEFRRQEAEQARQREEQRQENIRALTDRISGIHSGEDIGGLEFLCEHGETDPARHGAISLNAISEKFGSDISDAFAAGLKAFWRSYRPPFRFENDRIRTERTIGLAGLQLEFESGLDPCALHEDEVRFAARYATLEMNGFPAWFGGLAAAHAELVCGELSVVLEADLRLENGEHTEMLHKFRGLPIEVREPMAMWTLSILEHKSPENGEALENALRVCEWLPSNEISRLAALCESRLWASLSLKHAAFWWRAWAWADSAEAVGFLEEYAVDADPASLEDVVGTLAAKLDSWPPGSNSPSLARLFDCVAALERLVPLVYATIRPEDDKENETGMACFVDDRNHAEAFRSSIFDALVRAGDSAALERVAEDPRMAKYRDVLLKHARQAPQLSVLARAMTPSEAMEWSLSHAMPVRIPLELYRVALDRLDDIKEQVERGESSTRGLFAGADEKKFQPWLMQQLEQLEARHHQGYTVHREEEADRRKLPDLRLYHSACGEHPVSIEVKVAENCSGPELIEALEDQLVGRYLRASKSRHGVLLLCSRGQRKKWRLGGQNRDLAGAGQFLQAEADAIVHDSPDIDALSVVTLDFH
jgi:hypothetical protein